jgi:GNAT superfamily N-acetyltransferase
MNAWRVRKALPADARAIARVYVDTWRSAYPGILPDRVMIGLSVDRQASDWRRQIERAAPREGVLVAEAGKAVIGFSSFGPAAAGPHAGEIHTLYVLPDWQEQGVGRALLVRAFEALAETGFGSAHIWVLADNPSRFFYEAMGGRQSGQRDEQLWGALLREYAYGWPDLAAWLTERA